MRSFSSQLSRNTTFAGFQAAITIVSMFASYRILVSEEGLDRMGLWSILVAGASFARLADATGAGGLARFVADATHRGRDAAEYVHTILISIICLYGPLFLLAMYFRDHIVVALVDPGMHSEASQFLPHAMISTLLLGPLSAALLSGVDGIHRADVRAIIVSGSYIFFVVAVYFFVPKYGLTAWAYAIIAQQVLWICSGWLVLRHHLSGLYLFPINLSLATFRETASYGLRLQLMSIAGVMSDPLAKLLIGRYGGLDFVALYEMAARFILAARSIIVQMAQPLVPEFARVSRNRREVSNLLRRTAKASIRSSTIFFCGAVAFSPFFSLLMLDELSSHFIWMSVALAFAYAFNTAATPFFFAGVGCNFLRWNIASQVALSLSIVVFGVPLGRYLGAYGVVGAVCLGLVIGALVVASGNRSALC